jgi:hypothetical protein
MALHMSSEGAKLFTVKCGDELTIVRPLGLVMEPHGSLVLALYHNSITLLALPSSDFPATSFK